MRFTITFEVNFMDLNLIPWFLSLNNFIISNVFMKFSANSAYLTQIGAGQRDYWSKLHGLKYDSMILESS